MTAASSISLLDLSTGLAALVSKAAPSVVAVHSRRSRSSGFVWRPGLIVTAEEALADEGEVSVTLPGNDAVPAQVVGRDPTTDVALIRTARSDLSPVTPAPRPPAVGELVLIVGAQEGAPTAALGMVARAAGAWRSIRGGEIDARIELDVAMRRGAEGGLALDAAGRPLGMAVFGPRRGVLVIPASTVERVATTLEKHGRVARGYIGLGLQQVALQEGGEAGVMVMSVDPQGPGAAAGIRQGDILVTWDGVPVGGVACLQRALGPESVGRTLPVGLLRAGSSVQANLTISERPSS
ncbi:MAG TPA: S1C family serine protease [Microvirga sp.]|nr:S1C family serine protease [Microvirga sp.]